MLLNVILCSSDLHGVQGSRCLQFTCSCCLQLTCSCCLQFTCSCCLQFTCSCCLQLTCSCCLQFTCSCCLQLTCSCCLQFSCLQFTCSCCLQLTCSCCLQFTCSCCLQLTCMLFTVYLFMLFTVNLFMLFTVYLFIQLIFFYSDSIAYSNARYGQGTGPILLDNLACTGAEYNLTSCSYDADTSDCSHYEDAGVRCNTTCEYSVVCVVMRPAKRINL